MTLLVTASGTPVPPQDIVRRLERVGESVGTVFEMHYRPFMQAWAVMAKWRENDTRYGLIRAGRIADYPFDTVAHFPEATNADEAFHLFVKGLRRSNREDISKTVDHLVEWNERVAESNADKAAAPILDDVTSIAGRRLTGGVASFGGFGEKIKRKFRKGDAA